MTAPAGTAAAGTLRASRRLMWLLVVPVLALLGVLTALQYQQRMADAERDLMRRADERAQELEAIARPVMDHVHDLRRAMEDRWADPPDFGPELGRALTSQRLAGGELDGWSLDGAPETVRAQLGQFWWAPSDRRPADAVWLRRAQAFVEAARVVHQRTPGFEGTWFAAAEVNASFGYPWVATGQMLAAMGAGALQELDKPRRAGVQRAERDLAADPKDITFWGPPTVSQLNGELVMSHGAVVLVDGRYRGEVSLDFRLEELQRLSRRWQAGESPDHLRIWVVDRGRNVVADATDALQAPRGRGLADTRVNVALASRLPTGLALAELDATVHPRDAMHRGGGWALAAAGRAGSPWVYVQAVPLSVLRAAVMPTLVPNALLALALLVVFVAGQWLIGRWFVDPALQVLAYLRQLSVDAAAVPPQLGTRWRGWVAAVSETFRVQRELQARERAHEAFKSAMVDHAPTAIVTTDGAGLIVDFNPAAERLFGLPRAAALGRAVADAIIPERHRAAHRAEMDRLRAGHTVPGLDTALEMKGRHASGAEFPVQLLAFQIRLDGALFFTAFITDLSARQEAARQIEGQREALRQSEKLSAMGTLLAGVAHELNNPLAIVMGRASLLEEKTEGSALQADARRIREAAERCGRIVRTFLNMARHKPPERSAVKINDTVRAATDMLGYTLRSHGIVVELELAEGLPDVQADADQIGQVVLNLMLNAQQALMGSTRAAEPRRIRVGSGLRQPAPGGARGEPLVWLRVADNGPGVADAVRASIFEPFFTTKAVGFGTGLGLSVSRSIVREHGGELVLEDSARGASFCLSLPISGAAAPQVKPHILEVSSDEPHSRVLVVDDEPEIADLMRAVLEGAGHEVAAAESGDVALELLAEARFDAIVCDMHMPGLDGAGLWRAVRERDAKLARRMLFVTGDTLSPQARQLLEESGCPSLDKPFAKADLLAALRSALVR